MKTEFVLLKDGVEIDRVDPVREFTDEATEWVVYNGYHEYRFPKLAGYSYIIRNMKKASKQDEV